MNEHLYRFLCVSICLLCIILVFLIHKMGRRIMGFAQLNYSTSVILDMKTKSKEAQSEKTQFLRMLKLVNVICQPNCKSPRIYLHGNRTYAEKKNL